MYIYILFLNSRIIELLEEREPFETKNFQIFVHFPTHHYGTISQ